MTASVDIAFFGSSLVSAYWNGAATYYRGIVRALAARGHRVTFYEPDAYERQAHRDIADPAWARVVVYSAANEDGVHECLRDARKADVVVKASGVGIFDALLEAAVLELKSERRQVVFWDVDAPATLERITSHPDDSFRALIPRYDTILTYGGGPAVVSAYRRLGAAECVPVYNALDPSTHFAVTPDGRFAADLALLANRLPDREARIETFFFDAARKLPHKRFLLGGNGWQDKRMPPNVRSLGHVYTSSHNAFNSTPRAVLNVNRESMARFGWSPATRVFEASGAGACIITDAFEGIGDFLTPGREVLVAKDGAEVAAIVESLTAERAFAIGHAAKRRVLAHHTYDHRAALVEDILGGRARSQRPA